MDFVTWGGVEGNKFGESNNINNGDGLMWHWTKQEKKKSVIDSIYGSPKIVNQKDPLRCNGDASAHNIVEFDILIE